MNKAQWVVLLIVLSLVGCYDDKEGCLDPNAVNFDVSADKDCCCQYPALTLNVSWKENDTTFLSLNKVFLDDAQQPYKLLGVRFYLSHLEAVDVNQNAVDVNGESEKWVYGAGNVPEKAKVSDNVLLIKQTQADYKLGTFKRPGTYQGIRLDIGLDAQQNAVIPDSLSGENVLGFKPDSMWVAPKMYIQQQWIVMTDTSSSMPQVDTFQVLSVQGGVELAYNPLLVVPQGANYELKIAVDMSQWLHNIKWGANKMEILQKLADNSKDALSLVQ